MKRQADLDRNAGVLKEDGLPDSFNRLLGTTPEKFDAIKEVSMAQKIGPREQALRAMREAESKPVPVTALKKIVEAPAPMKKDRPAPAATEPKPEAPAPDEPKETPVNPTKKKTAKKTAKKAPKKHGALAADAPNTGAKGKTLPAPQNAPAGSSARIQLRDGEKKMDLVERLLKSAQGATRKQLSEATGWPYVNLKGAAKRAGDGFELQADGDRFRLVAKAAA